MIDLLLKATFCTVLAAPFIMVALMIFVTVREIAKMYR